MLVAPSFCLLNLACLWVLCVVCFFSCLSFGVCDVSLLVLGCLMVVCWMFVVGRWLLVVVRCS